MKLPGGLNNMLMHLAQLQVDYVNISTNCIYFNNGNQFEIHKHKTNEMHQIQDIFMWTTDTIQHCPKYKLVRINADWYKNEKQETKTLLVAT